MPLRYRISKRQLKPRPGISRATPCCVSSPVCSNTLRMPLSCALPTVPSVLGFSGETQPQPKGSPMLDENVGATYSAANDVDVFVTCRRKKLAGFVGAMTRGLTAPVTTLHGPGSTKVLSSATPVLVQVRTTLALVRAMPI